MVGQIQVHETDVNLRVHAKLLATESRAILGPNNGSARSSERRADGALGLRCGRLRRPGRLRRLSRLLDGSLALAFGLARRLCRLLRHGEFESMMITSA